MAEINYEVLEDFNETLNIKGISIKWPALADGDTGQPAGFPGHMVRSVQTEGVFGVSGATVQVKGRNGTAVDFLTLKDLNGDAMSSTAVSIASPQQLVQEMRPEVTGSASAAIDVFAFLVIPR